MLSVLLTEWEHEQLSDISGSLGIKKSEYVRALIQGSYIAHQIDEQIKEGKKDIAIEYGGYGYEIDVDSIKGILAPIVGLVNPEDLKKAVRIKYTSMSTQKNQRVKTSKLKKTA